MDPHARFAILARYGAWATARLFEAVDTLADAAASATSPPDGSAAAR